jgi:hypothetical protein
MFGSKIGECRRGERHPSVKHQWLLITPLLSIAIACHRCRRGDSNPHGLPHTPLKRTCLPVPPLRLSNFYLMRSGSYFFSGDAAGLTEGAGDAAGTAPPTGEAAGEPAGLADGDGCVVAAPLSRTTELGPNTPGNEKSNASNIKSTAATIVAFSSGFCAPRGPKAV